MAPDVKTTSSSLNALVSVILPAYNAERYLTDTIHSVIAQTYTNWELLIINDGSTDKTREIGEHFSRSDHRIISLTKNNTGVSDTRNYGIQHAKGNYFAFLDADDIWLPTNLEEKIIFLQVNKADMVYSSCSLTDENSVSLNKILSGSNEPQLEDILLFRGNYLTAPSGIVLTEGLMRSVKEFDPNLSNNADQDLWIRVLANGYRIGFLDKILWHYRIHSANMSGNIALLEKDSLYLYEKIRKNAFFSSYLFQRKCFSRLYYMLAGSWWRTGKNSSRALFFGFRAIVQDPFIIINFIK